MRAGLSPRRHCEELLRRSNPDCRGGYILDCFAALAMTNVVTFCATAFNENPVTAAGCGRCGGGGFSGREHPRGRGGRR
ncbi:hypothetical protein FXV83_31135 [Bradyrhizobium hipponense]|uniref:Uncharacterized protein n=1 Tax=Bradyrhizobium hipponense TaxID=2605638 RepID=A0A5S4YR06_9BRAD|nr:hypothetical protein FXV83_31135 [Bradyrhizobium hipponense]